MILDSFVHLFDVIIRILRVWKIQTHQIYATAVDHDRCFDGALTDVIGVDNSFPPSSVQHDSNSVFVLVLCSIHEDVVLMCFPKSQLTHVSTFHSVGLRPICSLRVRLPILRFFSLECMDLMFF